VPKKVPGCLSAVLIAAIGAWVMKGGTLDIVQKEQAAAKVQDVAARTGGRVCKQLAMIPTDFVVDLRATHNL
jgi:hypothetical protein